MSHPDIHHLAAAYALDAVDAHERQAFEAHLPTCEICRTDVADHRETLATIAAASPVPPSAGLKDRVLAEVATTRQLSPLLASGPDELAVRRRRRVGYTALAVAAATILLVTGALIITPDTGPRFADELSTILDAPDGRIVTLEPTTGSDGVVRVAWSVSAGKAAILGDGLEPSPHGHAYELWLIDETGPVAMQLLHGAPHGDLRAVLDIHSPPVAWGITVELTEGSPTPTGDVIFLAEA